MASLFAPSQEERLAKIERQKQLQQEWQSQIAERDRMRADQGNMPVNRNLFNPSPMNQNMYTSQPQYPQQMQPNYAQQPEQSFNNYNYTPQPPAQAPPSAGGVVRGAALDELRGISFDDRERKRQEQLKFRMDIERQIKEKQERKAKEKRELDEQIRKEELKNQGYNGFYPPTTTQPVQQTVQSQAMPQAMPQMNYYSPSPLPSNFPQFQQQMQPNMSYNNNGNNVVHPTNVPGLMMNQQQPIQQGPICISPFPQYNNQQPQIQYNNNNNNNPMMNMMMNQQQQQQQQFSPSHQQQQMMMNNNNNMNMNMNSINQPQQQQQHMMMMNMNQQNQQMQQQQQQQQQFNNNNNEEELPSIPDTGESISNLLKRVYKPKPLDEENNDENNNKAKVESKPKRSLSIKKKSKNDVIHEDNDSDEQREDKPKKQKKKVVDAYKKDKEREKYNNDVAHRMKAIEDKKREELQRKAEEREKRIKEKSKIQQELNPVKLPVKRASIHATKMTPTPSNNVVKPTSREANNKPKRHVSINKEVQILHEEEEEEEDDNDEVEDRRIIKSKQSPRFNTNNNNNNNNNNIKPSLIPKPNSALKRKTSITTTTKNSNNSKVSYISPVKGNDNIIDPEEIPIFHKPSINVDNNNNISPIQATPHHYDITRSKSPIMSPSKAKSNNSNSNASSYNELAEMCHKLEEEQEILKSELHQQFEIVKSLKSQTPRKPTTTNSNDENEFITPRGRFNNNNNKPHIVPSQSSSPTRQFSKIMTPTKISNVFTPKKEKDVLKQSIKQAGKSILDPLTPGQKVGRISSAHYSHNSSSESPTDFEPSRSKSSNMIGLKLDNICDDDIILTGDSRFYDVDQPFDVSGDVSCELMGNNKLIYDYYSSMEDAGKHQVALNVPPPRHSKLETIQSTNEEYFDDDGKNNEFSDSFDDDEDYGKEHDALDEFISTSKKGKK